jgi:type I restriction enzyme S subunit
VGGVEGDGGVSLPRVALGECCDIIGGGTPRTSKPDLWGGDIAWATPKDLSSLGTRYISETARGITRRGLDSCGAKILPAGSVLLSSRAPIGLVAINTVPMATNQGFKSLLPHLDKVDAGYLAHWLSANCAYLQSLGSGATFKEISTAVVSRIQIPLPSLEEQQRIARVLDAADALRVKRRKTLSRLNSLAESIFVAMFGTRAAGPPWRCMSLRENVTEFRYGTSKKSESKGIPTLRIPNVIGGSINTENLKVVPVEDPELARLRLTDGDVLFVRTNGNPDYVGRCAVFTEHAVSASGLATNEFVYASYLIRARIDRDELDPIFLREFLLSAEGRHELRSHCKTSAGQYNINIEGLSAVDIPRVPLELQREFSSIVNCLERVQTRHRVHLAHLDALFASLQDRAFKGGP